MINNIFSNYVFNYFLNCCHGNCLQNKFGKLRESGRADRGPGTINMSAIHKGRFSTVGTIISADYIDSFLSVRLEKSPIEKFSVAAMPVNVTLRADFET